MNGVFDATLSVANQMFRAGLDGCTFVKTALKCANDPDAYAPTGSLQLRPSESVWRLAAADQGRESPTPLKGPAMATLPPSPPPAGDHPLLP